MKIYKVTTIDQFHDKRVFTVAAKSQYEALTKASVSPRETVLTIEELFSTGETQTIKIKKAVKEEMEKRGVKSWMPHSVNTEIAYEVWGIDIDNFEKRLKKLRTLYGKDVRK